jgi:hypothetical protein
MSVCMVTLLSSSFPRLSLSLSLSVCVCVCVCVCVMLTLCRRRWRRSSACARRSKPRWRLALASRQQSSTHARWAVLSLSLSLSLCLPLSVFLSLALSLTIQAVADCQAEYDALLAQDRQLEKGFRTRREFADCGPIIDILFKLFKKRPKRHAADFVVPPLDKVLVCVCVCWSVRVCPRVIVL